MQQLLGIFANGSFRFTLAKIRIINFCNSYLEQYNNRCRPCNAPYFFKGLLRQFLLHACCFSIKNASLLLLFYNVIVVIHFIATQKWIHFQMLCSAVRTGMSRIGASILFHLVLQHRVLQDTNAQIGMSNFFLDAFQGFFDLIQGTGVCHLFTQIIRRSLYRFQFCSDLVQFIAQTRNVFFCFLVLFGNGFQFFLILFELVQLKCKMQHCSYHGRNGRIRSKHLFSLLNSITYFANLFCNFAQF